MKNYFAKCWGTVLFIKQMDVKNLFNINLKKERSPGMNSYADCDLFMIASLVSLMCFDNPGRRFLTVALVGLTNQFFGQIHECL